MVVIWGANFSVIKYALRDFPSHLQRACGCCSHPPCFWSRSRSRLARRGRALGAPEPRSRATNGGASSLLGIVGHLLYQLLFLAGVARTSVSNSALIFGVHAGRRWRSWRRSPVTNGCRCHAGSGAALSLAGIYVIVGHRASLSSATLLGDALVFAGMLCWSIYSVLAQPLLKRHSPLVVTGCSMAIGAALYLLVGAPAPCSRRDWETISLTSWVLMALSSLLALAFAYMVWYTAVQKIGSSRTAIYSNLTPIVAMIVAAALAGRADRRCRTSSARRPF